jgi:hypothetical protein
MELKKVVNANTANTSFLFVCEEVENNYYLIKITSNCEKKK